jgi:hypothetical protein
MKFNKKIIFSIVVVFIILNICCLYTQVFAGVMVNDIINSMNGQTVDLPTPISTVLHLIIAVVQVGITGIFIISLTIQGIRYAAFVAMMSPEAQKNARNRLKWTFIKGMIAFSIATFATILYNWLG